MEGDGEISALLPVFHVTGVEGVAVAEKPFAFF